MDIKNLFKGAEIKTIEDRKIIEDLKRKILNSSGIKQRLYINHIPYIISKINSPRKFYVISKKKRESQNAYLERKRKKEIHN